MNLRKSVVSFVILIIFSLVLTCCKSSTILKPVKIGLLVAMTDINNPNFISDKEDRIQAAQLAVEEINISGGIDGRPLELLIEDSQNYNPAASQKAKKLIDEGVAAIIGPNTSAALEFISDSITTRKGIVVISPSATSPVISNLKSDSNNTVWRICLSDEYQAQVAVRYLKNNLKKKSVSIIYINNIYGSYFDNTLKKRMGIYNIKIINEVPYPPEAEDNQQFNFGKYIPGIFKGTPEVIIIISSSEAGKLIKEIADYVEMKKINKPLIMGTDGNYDHRVLTNTNLKFIEGMIGTAPAPSKDDINFKIFAENFQKKYNKPVKSVWAPNYYDAVYLISYAILKEGEEKILNANGRQLSRFISNNLFDVASAGSAIGVNKFSEGAYLLRGGGKIDYQGASGDITFDKNGDATSGTYLFWKVQNGNFIETRTERYP